MANDGDFATAENMYSSCEANTVLMLLYFSSVELICLICIEVIPINHVVSTEMRGT